MQIQCASASIHIRRFGSGLNEIILLFMIHAKTPTVNLVGLGWFGLWRMFCCSNVGEEKAFVSEKRCTVIKVTFNHDCFVVLLGFDV